MADVISVETLDDARLEAFVSLTDTQLRNRLEPERGLFIAESAKVIGRALDAGLEPLSFLMEEKWLDSMAPHLTRAQKDFPEVVTFTASRDVLCELTGYDVTRGALAAFKRPPLPSLEMVLNGDGDRSARRVAVLEDITNAANVGAIFRSAAALGVNAVLLTPGCCDPLYRRAVRVSMGAVFQVPWTYIGNEVEGKGAHGNTMHAGSWSHVGIPQLQEWGFTTVALALAPEAVALDDAVLKRAERLALVLGTEGEGLADATIAACDVAVQIPMHHGVDSLNVATASAIAFWELRL